VKYYLAIKRTELTGHGGHASCPGYSGDGDRRVMSSMPDWENFVRPYLKNKIQIK
jgi:hypothetical protein